MKKTIPRMGRFILMISLFVIIKVFFPQTFIVSLNEFISSTGYTFKEAFFSSLNLMLHFITIVILGFMVLDEFLNILFKKNIFIINKRSMINTILGLTLIFINLVLFKITPKTINQQMLETFDIESSFSTLETIRITLQYIIKKGQWFINIGLLLIIGNSITKEKEQKNEKVKILN